MVDQRVDTVESYFKRVNIVSKISTFLFWISLLFSYVIFFTDGDAKINTAITITFIILTVLYFIFSNLLSIFLLREAQSKRRVHLLSNSLGIKLDDEETNLYYNNSQAPSILRLGMNVFENTLFTGRVTEQMVKIERVKVLIYILIWLLLVLLRDTNLNLISTVAQTIFTTGILVSWVKLEVLRYTCNTLFGEFRQLFLTNGIKSNKKIIASILNLVLRYETTVASMGVDLSTKTFNKINPTVTSEWERIKSNINL
ncbi:hypothetical protein M3649_19350 [Ureibacillus chungkukjangi]|uniref:hypothetical protein n=1 Tax=Ureibacillus chungkukjangi TaxID=1202712 RepID=UPI00203FC0AE|nr:hypothetical protein [Ureibacillus chungkukjangi]MCM3390258.1 hypothetical protein [Ureibacillus chungkukjangi]